MMNSDQGDRCNQDFWRDRFGSMFSKSRWQCFLATVCRGVRSQGDRWNLSTLRCGDGS